MGVIRGPLNHPEDLGNAIRQAREAQGKSQRDLAGELGLSQKWIWELEQGKPGLFTTRLFAALQATGVTRTAEWDDPLFDLPDDSGTR